MDEQAYPPGYRPVAFVLAGDYSSTVLDAGHLTALHRVTVEAATRTLAGSAFGGRRGDR